MTPTIEDLLHPVKWWEKHEATYVGPRFERTPFPPNTPRFEGRFGLVPDCTAARLETYQCCPPGTIQTRANSQILRQQQVDREAAVKVTSGGLPILFEASAEARVGRSDLTSRSQGWDTVLCEPISQRDRDAYDLARWRDRVENHLRRPDAPPLFRIERKP